MSSFFINILFIIIYLGKNIDFSILLKINQILLKIYIFFSTLFKYKIKIKSELLYNSNPLL